MNVPIRYSMTQCLLQSNPYTVWS